VIEATNRHGARRGGERAGHTAAADQDLRLALELGDEAWPERAEALALLEALDGSD
jgi:hypothetical protein